MNHPQSDAYTISAMDQYRYHHHQHDPFLVTLLAPWQHLLTALVLPMGSMSFVFSNSLPDLRRIDSSWQSWVSVLIANFLHHLHPALRFTNSGLEWFLNFLDFNGGLIRIMLLLALCRSDLIIWLPPKDSPHYLSVVGWLDTRMDLIDPAAEFKETDTKSFVDLCIMASKLAYESEHVQRYVLVNHWKMCFQRFLDCWNDRAQRNTTEAFVFTDKCHNADLIFVAFRGTEPFDADDWNTDFDFAWLQLEPDVGKVHMGFLEALGLVNREECTTFDRFKQNCSRRLAISKHRADCPNLTSGIAWAAAANKVDGDKVLAFEAINTELGRLLQEHPHAKLFLTGHSLGGALALLFAGVLMYKQNRDDKEDKILERLSAIHTFGQPRIGDRVFAHFLNKAMKDHNIDYYRIVYANDMVSRVPSDDEVFRFKHTGRVCYYYNSFFTEQVVQEVPNKNFWDPSFALGMWINAMGSWCDR